MALESVEKGQVQQPVLMGGKDDDEESSERLDKRVWEDREVVQGTGVSKLSSEMCKICRAEARGKGGRRTPRRPSQRVLQSGQSGQEV